MEIYFDFDGAEAKLFGAETSGQTYLYNKYGQIVFYGGITPSRSHMGDNRGSETIKYWLTTNSILLNNTSTFGCSLMSEPNNRKKIAKGTYVSSN